MVFLTRVERNFDISLAVPWSAIEMNSLDRLNHAEWIKWRKKVLVFPFSVPLFFYSAINDVKCSTTSSSILWRAEIVQLTQCGRKKLVFLGIGEKYIFTKCLIDNQFDSIRASLFFKNPDRHANYTKYFLLCDNKLLLFLFCRTKSSITSLFSPCIFQLVQTLFSSL